MNPNDPEILLAIVLALAAIFLAIWLFRTRRRTTPTTGVSSLGDPHGQIPRQRLGEIDDTPDMPVAWGYKNAWLAIRASNAGDVIDVLPIDNLHRGNWRTGIDAAYKGHTFVTPPVNGWVLVISQNLPDLGQDADLWTPLMRSLSRRMGEVQYFATHRVVEYHAWARFVDGEEQRAYGYVGESGRTLANRGAETPGEVELGYRYFDETSPAAESDDYWERVDLTYPDESHVMEIAGKWSINPLTLEDGEYPAGVGWIGAIRRTT